MDEAQETFLAISMACIFTIPLLGMIAEAIYDWWKDRL